MKHILQFLLVLLFGTLGATAIGQTFSRSYGLPEFEEEGLSLLPLNADTLFIAATKGDSTQFLMTDPDGNLLFNQSFKFAAPELKDVVTRIRLDSDNFIYGVGLGFINGTDQYEGFAFRYDYLSNQLQWNNTWSRSSDGFDIIEYTPGQYMIFGEDRGVSQNGENGLMARMDAATGTISQALQYDIAASETFRSSLFMNNDFYVAGRFTLLPNNNNKMRASLARLDVNGNLLQSQSFFSPAAADSRFYSTDLATFDLGSMLMTSYGNANGSGIPPRRMYLSRHDLNTNVIWGNEYALADINNIVPFEVERNGEEIYVLGRFDGNPQTAFLMGLDLNGNAQWCHSYPDYLRLPTGLSDGRMAIWNNSIYLTGRAPEGEGNNFNNIGLVRTELDGSLEAPCNTEVHVVSQVPNTLAFPNALAGAPSSIIDLPDSIPHFTPPIEEVGLCGIDPAPSPCFAASDSLFTEIENSVTLNGYNSWDGKMYLADGVIVTVQGANSVLDLTNVDLVFGECAGINVEDGARLRANNSVFRPCETSQSWRGLRFVGADSSFIHECTFKNAQQALHFEGVGFALNPLDCRVSNNLFVNNRTSILSTFMAMSGPVSGNTFLIDGQPINYSPDSCALLPAYAGDHWGIRMISTQWEAPISQNDFINGRGPDDPQDLFGILGTLSSGTISQNKFSNAFHGVELSTCTEVSVENNRFEATQNFFDLDNQIRATSNCNWIWITGNEVINSNEDRNGQAGIYVYESQVINIKENRVEGFAQGIQIRNLHTAQIAENELWNNLLFGIYQENGNGVDVNCNRIHMHYRPGQGANGMGYFLDGTEVSNNRFRSNCVWDAEIALVTSGTPGDTLPWIRNNYFYNYGFTGILNLGCAGSIGTAISPISNAGRNTFRSNNTAFTATAAAFDIFSTTSIVANGNTGIANVTPTVFVNGNNLHGSTAACGNQAGNVDAEFLAADICDLFDEQLTTQAEALRGSPSSGWEQLSDPDRYGISKAWMQYFISQNESETAAQIMADANTQLRPAYAQRLEIDHLWQLGSYGVADQQIALGAGNDRLLGLALIESQLMRGLALSPEQIASLQQWQNPQDSWGDQARDLLQLGAVRADYRFRDVMLPTYNPEARRVQVETADVTIFPNPNAGQFELEYAFSEGEEGGLEIYDAQGRIVFQTQLEYQAGSQTIDLPEIPTGIYLLHLRQGDQVLATRKWMKMK